MNAKDKWQRFALPLIFGFYVLSQAHIAIEKDYRYCGKMQLSKQDNQYAKA